MAWENVVANAGSGGSRFAVEQVTIGADTVLFPACVLAVGADGGPFTIVSSSAGLPVAQQGTWNITNISGTVSLPTGAATLAEQQTQTTALQLLDDTVATLGTTTYTETSTKANVMGAVRKDATGTLVNTDNEIAPLQVDSSGHLKVRVMTGAVTEYSEDDATPSVIVGSAVMVERDDSLTTLTPVEGDWASLRCDSLGALWTTISGTVSVNSHAVTNAGTFAVQVDGAALTALQLIDNIVLAEDAGHSSGDPGVAMFAVRNDSDTSLCGTTLDYTPLQVDANGYLKVNIKAGAGSGGTASTDDAAFTAASGSGTPMMGFVTSDSVDSGDVGVVGMLANRQLKVTLYDSAGVELAVGGGTQYTEDAAAAANPVGNSLIMVRADSLAGVTSADGDNVAARGTDKGELYVKHVDTIAATQSGTWNVTNISGTVSLPTGAATAANQATIIGHVDGLEGLLTTIDADTGNIVTSVELIDDVIATLGTTTYTEASTKAAVIGAVRKDATGTLVNTDNEVAPLQVDASGHLKVRLMDGITEYSEDVATPATISGTAIMMERDDALSTLTPIEGDWASLRCDSTGALWVSVNNTVSVNTHAVTQSGTWNITNVSGTVSLPTGASTLAEQQTQTTALSAIQTATQLLDDAIVADDAAFTPATTKVMMAGFEFDDTTPDSVNEGDAGAARMSANRCIYVNLRDNAGNERGLNVDASGNISVATVTTVSAVTSITNAVTVVGNAAHDAAVSGNPVLNAAEARTSESAVSASGDVVRLMADLVGKLVTMPYAPTDLQWQGTGSKTDTTDLAIKAAAGAGVRNYITDLICANSSATNVTVIVKDGSTEIARLPVPANGGVVHRFSTPLKGTANTAINLASSASATTIYMTAAGFTGR